MIDHPANAFVVWDTPPGPAVEIQVNFGVYAGREVTAAEIDNLAEWLLDEVPSVSVISEQRYEIGNDAKAVVHLVRVELSEEQAPVGAYERAVLEERLLERVRYWQRRCIADRHDAVLDLP